MQRVVSPTVLRVEANASCQLRCPTCPTTGKGYPPVVGSGYLKFDDFRRTLDDNPQLRKVEFENRGEMFLNPQLLQILEYGFNKNIPLFASSGANLNFVHEGILEGLVKYRLWTLRCSIDGATADTYSKYRIGGDFDRVIGHIKTINHFKQIYHSEYPKLDWQFVVFGHNEHELPLAKEMARSLNMSFSPKMSWDSQYSPIRNRALVMQHTGWPAVTREEFQGKIGSEYMRGVCYALWISPHINWNGKVLGCCWNSWAEFGGQAFEDGYLSVVNSESISQARNMLLGAIEPVEGLPCTSCQLFKSLRKTGNYLTEKEIFMETRFSYHAARTIYNHVPGLQHLRSLIHL